MEDFVGSGACPSGKLQKKRAGTKGFGAGVRGERRDRTCLARRHQPITAFKDVQRGGRHCIGKDSLRMRWSPQSLRVGPFP